MAERSTPHPPEQAAEQARLARGAAQLGVALPQGAADGLLRLLDELQRWNRAYNLTAVRERKAMLALHLLDSLSVQPWLQGANILDVGTGAGFPGLPLALIEPHRQFTLLDSNGKKIRFVQHASRVLALHNTLAVQARVEDYRPDHGFDTVVGRAFAPAARFAAGVRHLLAPGGRLLMMKGRDPQVELAELADEWAAQILPLHVPELDQARHLVILALRAPR